MLFRNDASRDALNQLALPDAVHGRRPYRSQHGGHELVRLLSLHQAPNFENTNGEAGYDSGMLGQRLFQHLAVLLVIFQRFYLRYAAEAFESA